MSYPKRAAAVLAEELNRAELARGVQEEEDEEEDSDYVSEGGGDAGAESSSSKSKKRRRIVVVDSSNVGAHLTEALKRRGAELYAALRAQDSALSKSSSARAAKVLGLMLKEEFEEDPAHEKFRQKRMKRLDKWTEPMLFRTSSTSGNESVPTGQVALDMVKQAMSLFGTQEVQEKVRFAGETISVAKKVDKRVLAEQGKDNKSGLDEVLDGINKKRGITTVEKSSYDWEKYKEENNLSEELKDASKAGFVDKQAFLQRVDERQFEAERAIRDRERAVREANAPKRSGE